MTFDVKVQARKLEHWRDGQLVTKFHPQIRVDNRWVFISDVQSESGTVECDTREEARARAYVALEKALGVTQ